MNGIRWQRYIGQWNETLGQFGKTHATDNDKDTMCGVTIPAPSAANVEGESLHAVDCKKCMAHAEKYEIESKEFDKQWQ